MKQGKDTTLPVLRSWEKWYESEGETVLTAESLLPHCPEGQRGSRRFNRFYDHLQQCFQRRTLLLSAEAAQAHAAARAASRWFQPWRAVLNARLEADEEAGTLTVSWCLTESGGFTCAGEERWSLPGLLLLG